MHINILDFVKYNQKIHKKIDISSLSKAISLHNNLTGNIEFTLSSENNNKNRTILNLHIYGKIIALCQNCLNEVEILIDDTTAIPLFMDENESDMAMKEDNDEASSGIIADAEFNILNFVEDEIIMLMPVAPRHENC